MRKYLCASAALVLAVVVAGCGSGGGKSSSVTSNGGAGSSKQYAEFRLGVLEWEKGVDFHTSGWDPPGLMESLVVQNLVELDRSGQPRLVLARSVEHPSPTTYIYNIKPGVKFSNGKPLTVADVIYSLNLNSGKFSIVKTLWEVVASVSARGSSAVVIKLKQPDPDWTNLMAAGSEVIEKAATEKVPDEKLGLPHGLIVGTGPWKFDSYTPTVGVELSRNLYWSGQPQPAAKIHFTIFKEEAAMALALRSGTIDGAADYESQRLFKSIPGTHQLAGTPSWSDWISMNTAKAPFNNVHVRRAIAYATDASGMLKVLYPEGGAVESASVIPASQFTALASAGKVSTMLDALPRYRFDLAMAKQELSKSPYPHGFTTKVEACVVEPVLLEIAQIVSDDLAKIGVVAKVKELEIDEVALTSTDAVNMFVNEQPSYVPNEPDEMMLNYFSPSNIGAVNWARYNNPELSKLLPTVADDTDPVTRLSAIERALTIAGREVPYVPILTHSMFMTVSDKFTYIGPGYSFFTSVYAPWALNMELAH